LDKLEEGFRLVNVDEITANETLREKVSAMVDNENTARGRPFNPYSRYGLVNGYFSVSE
jgi:hypothetical protein